MPSERTATLHELLSELSAHISEIPALKRNNGKQMIDMIEFPLLNLVGQLIESIPDNEVDAVAAGNIVYLLCYKCMIEADPILKMRLEMDIATILEKLKTYLIFEKNDFFVRFQTLFGILMNEGQK